MNSHSYIFIFSLFFPGEKFDRFGHITVTDSINNVIAISSYKFNLYGNVYIYKIYNETTFNPSINVSKTPEPPQKYKLIQTILPTVLTYVPVIYGFGSSISIYNNTLVIAASNSNIVCIYKFDLNNNLFILIQIIPPMDANSYSKFSNFGVSVSISGDYGTYIFMYVCTYVCMDVWMDVGMYVHMFI